MHIKANANLKKAVKRAVLQVAKTYEKQLTEEINEDRDKQVKKSFNGSKPHDGKELSPSLTLCIL